MLGSVLRVGLFFAVAAAGLTLAGIVLLAVADLVVGTAIPPLTATRKATTLPALQPDTLLSTPSVAERLPTTTPVPPTTPTPAPADTLTPSPVPTNTTEPRPTATLVPSPTAVTTASPVVVALAVTPTQTEQPTAAATAQTAPWIMLPRPEPGTRVPAGKVALEARGRGAASVAEIRLTLDGVALPVALDRRSDTIWRGQASAAVAPGTHTVRAQVLDVEGRSGSYTWQFVAGGD